MVVSCAKLLRENTTRRIRRETLTHGTHSSDDEAKDLYAKTRDDLLKRQLSNSENYDKAILSLSTAFLGLSLAFLKDIVPVEQSKFLMFLYCSWGALVFSVVCTISSFLVSQKAIDVQLKIAADYYLHKIEPESEKTIYAINVERLNALSGILFTLGLVLSIAFVIINVSGREQMSSDKKSGPERLKEGAPIPKMQVVPEKRGATIPPLQQVSPPQPSYTEPTDGTAPKPAEGSPQSDGEKE